MDPCKDVYVVTEELEIRFRTYVEGCIPDLEEASGQRELFDGEEYDATVLWDAVKDFAGDRACDTFPKVPHEERGHLAKRIADYFYGKRVPKEAA